MPTVNVEDAAYNDFAAAVLAKHGKLRGAMMTEATAAIQAHTATIGKDEA